MCRCPASIGTANQTRVQGPNDSGRYRHWQPVREVQHRVDYRPQVGAVLAAALAGRTEHRLQQLPLLVGQVMCGMERNVPPCWR